MSEIHYPCLTHNSLDQCASTCSHCLLSTANLTLTEPHKVCFWQGVRRLWGAEPRENHQILISFLTFHHLSVSKMKPQQRIACSHVGQPQAESRRISYIRHFRRHPPRPNTWPYGLRGRPGHHRNLVAHAAADHFVIGHMM